MGSPVTIGKRPGVPGATLQGRGKSTPGRSGAGLPDASFKDCLPKLRPRLGATVSGLRGCVQVSLRLPEFASGCNDPLPVVVFPIMKSSTLHAPRGPVRAVPRARPRSGARHERLRTGDALPGHAHVRGWRRPDGPDGHLGSSASGGDDGAGRPQGGCHHHRHQARGVAGIAAAGGLVVDYTVTNTGAQPLLAYDVVPQDLGSATLPTDVDVTHAWVYEQSGVLRLSKQGFATAPNVRFAAAPVMGGHVIAPGASSVGGRMPRRRRSWTCRGTPSMPHAQPWTRA